MNEDEIIPPSDEKQQPVRAGETLSATDSAVAPGQVERSSLAGFSAGEGKSFGVRAGAYIIDTIILNAVIFAGAVIGAVGLSIVLTFADRRIAPNSTEQGLSLRGFLAGLALSILYFGVFEWLFGATPGKAILKMRVVREDGGRPRLWQVLVRGVFRFIDGLFFGIPAAVAIDRDFWRQRFGDRYAHTLVVDHRAPIIQMRRSWAWFVTASVVSLIMLSSAGTLLSLETMQIAPLLSETSASELNLTLDDLEGEYGLEAEVGKDAFEGAQLTDASVRLFASNEINLQAQVLTFPFVATDAIADLVAPVQQELADGEGNETLTFDPLRTVRVGDRAGVLHFTRPATDSEGYVLFFIRRNVVARLICYGAAGAMTEEELLRLAERIDERIR